MQELTAHGHLPGSNIETVEMWRSLKGLEIKSIDQKQLETIIKQLPIEAAWIVYRPPGENQRQFLNFYNPDQLNFDETIISQLKSEFWLLEKFPFRELIELEFWQKKEKIKSEQKSKKCWVYGYRFLEKRGHENEYALLWSDAPLCNRKKIQEQMELLENYLTVAWECDRQQQQIQFLEQVIRQGEHQMRNSLAMISLYAENLCLGLPDGLFKEQANVIRETVSTLSANLKNMIPREQLAKMRLLPCELREVFVESIQVLKPKIEQKQLRICYPESSVILSIDRWQMKQVFENILSNAVDFSPVGGTVTCNWRVFRKEVLVEICDRGPGLSPEDLRAIFNPFYSRRPGGTGLGLTIAQKIILAHQGSIWAENLPEGGAQFCIALHRYTSDPSPVCNSGG